MGVYLRAKFEVSRIISLLPSPQPQNETLKSPTRLGLTDGKRVFDVPAKKKEEAYQKIIVTTQNNDYTAGNLLDYEYFSKHYKLIAIDLSKQIELGNPDLKQQINFIAKLEDDRATMFFIIEKSEERTFEFPQNSLSII